MRFISRHHFRPKFSRWRTTAFVSNKFRSFLTILGIVVGILTAVVVASILTGFRQNVVKMFEEYGTNNIYLFHLSTGLGPSNRDERNRKPLTMDDASAIVAQAPSVTDVATVAINIGSWGSGFDDNMIYKDKNYRWALTDGVTPNYDQIANVKLKTGRWLTEMDNYNAVRCSLSASTRSRPYSTAMPKKPSEKSQNERQSLGDHWRPRKTRGGIFRRE